MLFGMTRGELVLVVFVFALVYFSLLIPKLGARIGRALSGKPKPPAPNG